MNKTVIYIKLVKGTKEYRDNEGHQGKTITTHAKYGDKIIWKLDRCSGITEINNIEVTGDVSILKSKPQKIDFDHWEAMAADKGEGQISYNVVIEGCKECCESSEFNTEVNYRTDVPFIRLP